MKMKKCLLLIFITISVLFSNYSLAQTKKIDETQLMNIFNESQDCLSKGQYEKAIELKTKVYNLCKGTDWEMLGGMCAADIAEIQLYALNNEKGYIDWLEKAESCGNKQATGLLGDVYFQKGDYQKAKSYFEKSNEPRCIWFLATMYREQGGELGRNDEKYLYYMTKAADMGDPDAQFYLGLHYYSGRLVPIDKSKGISYLKKAAAQNHAPALEVLQRENIK